jgi:hypothetical protein
MFFIIPYLEKLPRSLSALEKTVTREWQIKNRFPEIHRQRVGLFVDESGEYEPIYHSPRRFILKFERFPGGFTRLLRKRRAESLFA